MVGWGKGHGEWLDDESIEITLLAVLQFQLSTSDWPEMISKQGKYKITNSPSSLPGRLVSLPFQFFAWV